MGVDLDDREVSLAVHANQPSLIFSLISMQLHFDPVDAIHHMVVGDDVTVLIHDKSGTGLLAALALRRAIAAARTAEETMEQVARIVVAIIVAGGALLAILPFLQLGRVIRGDVYHARLHLLGELGELIADLGRLGEA